MTEAIVDRLRGQQALVIDLLGSLVDKSLVVPTRRTAGDRYQLLETLRQYGEVQLEERGGLTDLRDRHLGY